MLERHNPGQLERPAIEAALIDEVVARGYPQAGADGVCRRAGVDGESFNRYFADLEDGYCLVLERLVSEIFGRIGDALEGEETWQGQMRAAAYAIFDYFGEDHDRAIFIMVEAFFAGERAQLIRDGAIEVVTDLIDQGRLDLLEPETLSRATSEAIAGSVFHQVRWALEREDPDAAELVPQLMYSVVQPYLGIEEGRRELAIARHSPAA
jgi:AcrR family transcriptional regulator